MDEMKEKKYRLILIVVILILISFLSLTTPPQDFEIGQTVTIEEGQTVKGAGEVLKDENIIRSRTMFNIFIALSGGKVVEGDYFFQSPTNIFQVVSIISGGKYNIPTKNVTLFEGSTVVQMAESLAGNLPDFDTEEFIELATEHEGYLFPDTYKFQINVKPEVVVDTLRATFGEKISATSTREAIEASPYSLEEIVIMASIVEKEATRSTLQEVSDVLWNRIDIGMALQVDATFKYFVNKGTFDLTKADLKEDHPYNTYVNKGLVPTPISNPGISSLLAAANPQPTNYLFFLTGRDGNMYFATNFAGHKNNRALYLD